MLQWDGTSHTSPTRELDRYAATVFRSVAWVLTLLVLIQVALRKGWL